MKWIVLIGILLGSVPAVPIVYEAPMRQYAIIDVEMTSTTTSEILIDYEQIPLACSCIKYIRHKGFNVPYLTDASDIMSNTTVSVGVLAVFNYNGVAHVGLVVSIEEDGFIIDEANFISCIAKPRFVYWIDPFLGGFHK